MKAKRWCLMAAVAGQPSSPGRRLRACLRFDYPRCAAPYTLSASRQLPAYRPLSLDPRPQWAACCGSRRHKTRPWAESKKRPCFEPNILEHFDLRPAACWVLSMRSLRRRKVRTRGLFQRRAGSSPDTKTSLFLCVWL